MFVDNQSAPEPVQLDYSSTKNIYSQLLDFMMENPQRNRLIMRANEDTELGLQLELNNNHGAGRNIRTMLRSELDNSARPLVIGGFTQVNGVISIDYQIRRN